MKRWLMKLPLLLPVAVLCLLTITCTRRCSYVEELVRLQGTPYSVLNCSEYIAEAKQAKSCSAAQMYNGCDGAMYIVQDVPSFSAVDYTTLLPGDVAAFNGRHVAGYIGHRQWFDSDPKHVTVGPIQLHPHDSWFTGRVRIMRWKE